MARMQAAQTPAPPSGQVVAVDGGDDGVVEAEDFDGAGEPQGLHEVEALGFAGGDGAEAAGAGADVAEDDEGGFAGVEALADVGAVGLFADAVEVVLAEEGLDLVVAVAGGEADSEPVGLGQAGASDHGKTPRRALPGTGGGLRPATFAARPSRCSEQGCAAAPTPRRGPSTRLGSTAPLLTPRVEGWEAGSVQPAECEVQADGAWLLDGVGEPLSLTLSPEGRGDRVGLSKGTCGAYDPARWQAKTDSKAAMRAVFDGGDGGGGGEEALHGGDFDAAEAAGDDGVEAGEVDVDVEGEAVRGDAALDADADGAELGEGSPVHAAECARRLVAGGDPLPSPLPRGARGPGVAQMPGRPGERSGGDAEAGTVRSMTSSRRRT